MDAALPVFFAECGDLLEQMEANLLAAERGEIDSDSINAIFRAAHTIKGSAGIFGYDEVVAFAHRMETVLDDVRGGRRSLDGELVAVLLACCDHLHALVEQAAGSATLDEGVRRRGAELGAQLRQIHGVPPAAERGPAHEEPQLSGEACAGHWHLSLRFDRDVLRHGLDPIPFIRYLKRLGQIEHLVTVIDALPPAAEMDPESCYLGYEIGLLSEASKHDIENVFEFLQDDSQIRILPPHSRVADYLALIRELPEEEMKLGEMLVACGTLTRKELQTALHAQARRDGEAPRLGKVLVQEKMVQPAVVDAALEKQRQVKESRAGEASLVRVDADKLDHHINLVGELIIATASASLAAQRSGAKDLVEIASTLGRLVEEVRDSALTLRMVQIGATFNRFQRVVRDVSHELGKEIHLVISGGETELDKTVIERIGDPLTHLVRNAVDHGIESAEVRRAAGKPLVGTVRLNAYHESGNIIVEVSDDGGGLDKERIRQMAIEKGMLTPEQSITDRELFNFVFEPGFSTARSVSSLSGRGVGMDVVRRNIQALRGSTELESAVGRGTTVRIRLPLTLAIIDGFLVGVGDAAYVIPLETVVECIENTARNGGTDAEHYLNLRGEVLPYLRIRDQFMVHGERKERENIVVVRHGDRKAGLAVDALLGEFQTVIRPLGRVFDGIAGVGGFTILGSGDVALILDVPGLLRQVAHVAENRTDCGAALAIN
jgi:two-component system chemotaxis sensor kinase CheA